LFFNTLSGLSELSQSPRENSMHSIRIIGLDADDTLWHNENIFEQAHIRYRRLLSEYHDAKTVDEALLKTEKKNLRLYGYGIKGFMLSAIETAISLSGGRMGTKEIHAILDMGKEMLEHPVELIDGVAETISTLAESHRLILITKGDLKDQHSKLAKSGLSQVFSHVEVVSEKTPVAYANILHRLGISPAEFLMVGNSMKSDILPVLALGGAGVHIPYHLQWVEDCVEETPEPSERFMVLDSFQSLPTILKK
jgi:putative hydrolase of the HAD superfamily